MKKSFLALCVLVAFTATTTHSASAYVYSGQYREMPADVSSIPLWEMVELEPGDIGPWNHCLKWIKQFGDSIDIMARECSEASAMLSGVTFNQFDRLLPGFRLWVPSFSAAPAEIMARSVASESAGVEFLVADIEIAINILNERVTVVEGAVVDLEEATAENTAAIENQDERVDNLEATMSQITGQTPDEALRDVTDQFSAALEEQAEEVSRLGENGDSLEARVFELEAREREVATNTTAITTSIPPKLWGFDWWWVILVMAFLLLGVIFVVGFVNRRATKVVAENLDNNIKNHGGRLDAAEEKVATALRMAKLSIQVHLDGFEIKGDPISQEELERKLEREGDVLDVVLINIKDTTDLRVVKFTRLNDPFNTGEPGLRVDGIIGQRRPIVFRASNIFDKLVKASRANHLSGVDTLGKKAA